jgi:hypothetical protein
MSQYYIYYDYGITTAMTGPGIGMATMDNVISNLNESHNDIPQVLNIYPNPARNKIIISSAVLEDEYSIFIYDIYCRLIDDQSTFYKAKELKLDVSDLPPGVYMVVVKGKNQITAQGKFVKQ